MLLSLAWFLAAKGLRGPNAFTVPKRIRRNKVVDFMVASFLKAGVQ